jgi:hypothetical protein
MSHILGKIDHTRNLCDWWMDPLSNHDNSLYECSCMVEIIRSHSRLNAIVKGVPQFNHKVGVSLSGNVGSRHVYLN